jgi:chemotaxis receptor (MCP) glutamine deamidase CheD
MVHVKNPIDGKTWFDQSPKNDSRVPIVSLPRVQVRFRDPFHNSVIGGAGIMRPMPQPLPEIIVQNDQFCVSRDAKLLTSELRAALAVCVYDDTQAVGGLLHLRYVATDSGEPVDLTDNTLSSDLLLMDRFCKELRSAGARKQSWRVSIFGHTPPEQPDMAGPAATVLDLAKAYFADARLPVECREVRRPMGLVVRFHSREGHIWVNGTSGTAASARLAAPVRA